MKINKKKTSDHQQKVYYGKCEECLTRIERRSLFTVRDKTICLECGQKEIDKWNAAVREGEHG